MTFNEKKGSYTFPYGLMFSFNKRSIKRLNNNKHGLQIFDVCKTWAYVQLLNLLTARFINILSQASPPGSSNFSIIRLVTLYAVS